MAPVASSQVAGQPEAAADCGWGILLGRNVQETGDLALIAHRGIDFMASEELLAKIERLLGVPRCAPCPSECTVNVK